MRIKTRTAHKQTFVRRFLVVACLVTAAAILLADVAWARPEQQNPRRNGIDVVKVDGLLDPPTASLVREAVSRANRQRSTMIVLQLDSGGSVGVDVQPLLGELQRSQVPVVVWVGPSGAKAKGAATLLAEAAPVLSVSSGSSIGPAHPVRLDEPGATDRRAVGDRLASLAVRWGRDGAGARRLAGENLSADAAHHAGAINTVEPTVGELIVSLDGRAVPTASGPKLLSTATVVGEGLGRRRQPNQEVRFDRLDIGNQLLHTLISPSIAYLLFVAGLALMVFEFYTCGIGLAGLAGAAALIGALVGFSHLPVAWWAAGLLLLAVFGFAVDVQAGGLGVWTFIGAGSLLAGSLTLYGGDARLNPPWWVLAIVIVGTALFMLGAMTAVVRSRFSTPTVGREGMVGEEGRAEVDVAPDGVVVIQGARWRARTNRATPIGAGDAVRVVAVEGLVLEVEPEAGGARDYRDRARRRAARRDRS
ncbi:MAG TPA: NfeD family protein [Acidimicrobiia bacterium]|nr:NfeD family protein [Acidimicrobiia bacterium]